MINLNKTGLKVAVHNGVMHADDVFSMAAIAIINPYVNIIRTRDKALLDICDLRVDVGNKYDPETGDFDHHQEGFNERNPAPSSKYAYGPKLCGFGLIWRHYAPEVILAVLKKKQLIFNDNEISDRTLNTIAEAIRKSLVAIVDAGDNGELRTFYLDTGAYRMPSIMSFIQMHNPDSKSAIDEAYCQKYFYKAVKTAKGFLTMLILKEYNIFLSIKELDTLVETNTIRNGQILVLPYFIPWSRYFTENAEKCKNIYFIVFPSNENWMAQSTYYNSRVDAGKFSETMKDGSRRTLRCPYPEHIAGKRDEELATLTHIPDATFIHTSGFLGAATSKEGAIALAEYALSHMEETNGN